MLDEKIAGLVCSVAGKFDITGRHYMAASYWFDSKFANGFKEFAKKEAKERWHYAGKLYSYVSERGFTPIVGMVPAIQTKEWPTVDVAISVLKKHDDSTLQFVSGMVKQVTDHGSVACGVHLAMMENSFQKDFKEICEVEDHIKTNPTLAGLNESLYRKYGSGCTS